MTGDGAMGDDELDRAIGDWLDRKESEPGLLPGAFAATLPAPLRALFLAELEALAEVDGLATQAPPRDLPRRFGDFRVLGELGRGAMGSVYDAEQVSSGRRVALKVMHAHIARDLRSASRFQREARTAAALVHPGIVPVLAFGETDDAAWLAMARVEGRSLQRLLAAAVDARDVDHVRARALLDEPRRLARVLADAADALEFAHRHNVVHRDVKPANLMLGDDGRIVVLDFGLATAHASEAPALTRTGDLLGTPLYMAPEQAVGAENGMPQSDVYALGAVLYECLCGRPPAPPGPLATVIDAILNREPDDPRRLRRSVPDALANIALQCLEKEPARRYATAAALADDLRRFVDGVPVRARPVGLLQRSMRRLRRRPALAVLGAAVLLLVPAVVLSVVSAGQRASQATSLQRELDLARIPELLGRAPERLTVFGGASLRFWSRLGLGEHVAAGPGARSPEADRALQLAGQLAAAHPGDAQVLRTLAEALLDVGDDAARTGEVLAALLALPHATPADRAMAAVWHRQRGDAATAERLRAGLPEDDPQVAYWLGFWHQLAQDHGAAIAAFTRAIRPELDVERRYFALLHRGWCRTCPDVCELERAQDDLLQAHALRPRHGTARLLWATLRCLEASSAEQLNEPVAAVTEVLANAEPWLHVLTARVLQALAEAGTWQSGPVHFGAEFSPIGVLPVQPEFAAAFAGLSLQLLDGALQQAPRQFEAQFHRIAALALLGRHDEALLAADELQAASPASRAAVLHLQRARVQLAAGRTQRAREAVDRALDLDHRFAAAWRFAAGLAAHTGDRSRELFALERAILCLRESARDACVFPDAAAMLPELQLARARALHALGRDAEALAVLDEHAGGVLAGEQSARFRVPRALLRAQLGAVAASGDVVPAIAAGSPLAWLTTPAPAQPVAVTPAVRAALWRHWLPAPTAQQLAADASIERTLQAHGARAPASFPDAGTPLITVLPHVPALVQGSNAVERLLQLADERLAHDRENGEARLLRALVLFLDDRSADAARFLADTLDAHPDDLRGRYLLAAAARASGDQQLLRLALQRDRTPLAPVVLDAARAALRAPVAVTGEELVSALR